ncbi:MAG: DUF3575 domain-containing protein, partial [Muribaculaceae bacterium]|nr:DUF3575 domain-containing protein [Muribaculaceae bacterium]
FVVHTEDASQPFEKNRTNMNLINETCRIKRLIIAIMLAIFAFPLSARECKDSVFTFRFYSGRNMFYSPGLNNGEELKRMFDCVDRFKRKIVGHEIYLEVNGYSDAKVSDRQNLLIAKIRSNRVKSELITRKGLTESCFITRNHVGEGNFVTVSLVVPLSMIENEKPAEDNTSLRDSVGSPSEVKPVEVVVPDTALNSEPHAPIDSIGSVVDANEVTDDIVKDKRAGRPDSRLALKTNLLYYAILMPNVEIEWMFKDRWSAALEVQGAWYAKESAPRKVYRIATIMPEFRYWPIEKKRWHGMYVGVFGGAGMYDLSNDKKGHEGEGYLAGVSVGYMWPIGRHLSLEAGLGVGYMRLHDKEYRAADGHFLYQMTKNINYFGPLRVKLSLIWRIPEY